LKDFLDDRVDRYNRPAFIENDPISIPHRFRIRQDMEIAGLLAALLAWGQRITVINKCNELLGYLDDSPYDFLVNHSPADWKSVQRFKHRTFNGQDATYFLTFLSYFYRQHRSLEAAFPIAPGAPNVESALLAFHNMFFSLPNAPARTRKHVPTPARKSACKRINMFLRWMVRKDDRGVDFGLWNSIRPDQLICPCDVHVERVARQLKLVKRKAIDWETALELTRQLKKLDPTDPVKYDFALFGLGIEEKFAR
jgi:uncharacterized protein (TIGR02757 family)